jgi:hypothetical protein
VVPGRILIGGGREGREGGRGGKIEKTVTADMTV